MQIDRTVTFKWKGQSYSGVVEREYDNSYLIQVANACEEIAEKYKNRLVISKKNCQLG